MANGSLNIRTRLGGKKVYSRSVPDKIDNNEVHLISIIRDRNNFTVSRKLPCYIDSKCPIVVVEWPFLKSGEGMKLLFGG